MTGNKQTYAIAIAIFAGLTVIAATNIFSGSVENNYAEDLEAYAQYSPIVGIRQNAITVSGSASTSADPDQLVVSFGVDTQALTASDATQQNAQKMTAVVNAVQELGIKKDEISTSNFSIFPVYDKEGRSITGYRTSNTVTVTTDKLQLASKIIDTAVDAGANRVNNIFFTLSDDVRKKLSDQLIEEAVKDAKMKAELALKPLDMQIIGVKSISLEHFIIPQPIPFERVAAEAAFAPPTPIFESEQQVSMSVTVVFLI
jgi:uncharacterized protein YggE